MWYKNVDNTIGNVVVDPRDCFILRDDTVKKDIIAADGIRLKIKKINGFIH